MAATKKSQEIRAAKQHAADEINAVRAQIVAACGRVPARIVNADAIKSVEWRDRAESELSRCTNHPWISQDGNTLADMQMILAKDRAALEFLS